MNATYIRIDLARQLRSMSTIMFVFVMPALMYILFGATASYGDEIAGRGNARFYVMAAMAAYGAVTAAVSIAGTAANEATQGWGRQLALTKQSSLGFVLNKVAVALAVASVAEALVFVVGVATGAKADGWVWLVTYVIALAGAAVFAVFGMAAALLFGSDQAVGIASSMIVLFSFLGNVFTPLAGTMLDIAHWTPMYGYIGLVRWPQLSGQILGASDPSTWGNDPMWQLVASLVAWTMIFVAMALRGARRTRARQ